MANIFSLPFELIEIVLKNCSFDDILNFSRTCRTFETVSSSPIWADKLMLKWPELEAFRKCDLDWGNVYHDIINIRKFCWNKIQEMPALYHRTGTILPDADLLEFSMKKCDNPERSRFFVKMYLVEICSSTVFYEDFLPVVDKLNMTHQYYAALILDHLNQIDLREEFSNLFRTENNLPPEGVLQFFNRWIEPKNGHPGELITFTIKRLTERVHGLIPPDHPFHKIDPVVKLSWSEKLITDNFYPSEASVVIINLVREVLDHEGFIIPIEATIDSLIIRNDIKKIRSNSLYSGIFFESVLRRCGVRCDLFYFSKHHLVVWRESWGGNSPMHLINLFTGNITPSANRCPYANRPSSSSYTYNPLRLLEVMAMTFRESVLYTNNRLRKNVLELMALLNDTSNFGIGSQAYDNVSHQLAEAKLMLNGYSDSQNVKKIRPPGLKFAIGMVCFHKLYGYKCIIRGWDLTCMESNQWKRDMGVHRLQFGENQPFYQVIAADSTNRYVAEENLGYCESILRLKEIEDIIAQEFSHFNGFFYVPNEQKKSHYSEDLQVICSVLHLGGLEVAG